MSVSRFPAHPHATNRVARHAFASVIAGALGFGLLASCSSGDNGNPDAGGSSGGSGSSGSGGASGSGSGGGSGGSSSSGSGGSGGSSGVASSGGSGGSSGGSGSSGASGSGSGGSSSGTTDGGPDGTVARGDGGGLCTNTDMTKINIDPSGFACNNQWGITGAWYCFSDTVGTSSCKGTGDIPFNTTSNAMCISGQTGVGGSASYGAAIGVELNHVNPDAGPKSPYDTTQKNIVGFAVTISGDSGGSVLNINFPTVLSTNKAGPAVTVPGVNSATSPITYSVLLSDAFVNNTGMVAPLKIDPKTLTDVQVQIPGDGVSHTYNFCVTKVTPIMAPVTPASGNYGPTFDEQSQIIIEGLGPYGVQNDVFKQGAGAMLMQATFSGGQVGFTASPSYSSGNTPLAFPSIVYGWVQGGNFIGGRDPGGYAGGATIQSLNSVLTSWAFTPGSGNGDAAYDCWFATNPTPINAEVELMVWLWKNNVNPLGNMGPMVMIDGRPFIVWMTGPGQANATGQPVVSYVSTTNMTSAPAGFNLKPFFAEAAAASRGQLAVSSHLLSVQAGFEIYSPGNWTTNSYSVSAK